MKKIRIRALLCAVLMILSAVPLASAAPAPKLPSTTRIFDGYWSGENYYLANKEKKTFYLFPENNWCLHDTKGVRWSDLIYDSENVVNGKSSAKWLQILDVG